MPSDDQNSLISNIRFPEDKNFKPVAVLYTLDIANSQVVPIAATKQLDGSYSLNTVATVTVAPSTMSDSTTVAVTPDTYGAGSSGDYDTHLVINKTIIVKNTGANAIEARIYGSLDATNFDVLLLASTTIAAGQTLVHYSTNYFYHTKVQVRNKVAGAASSAVMRIAGID